MDSLPSKPPRPSDKPLRPSNNRAKPGDPELFKDRRTHKIELRNKITKLKEEMSELKNLETSDEAKQAEIQEQISELKIKLKYCVMEKEAIENFNHTQFLNNLKASDQNQTRFTDENTGNTRFFDNVKASSPSKAEESKPEPPDSSITEHKPQEALAEDKKSKSSSDSESVDSSETQSTDHSPPRMDIPPNIII